MNSQLLAIGQPSQSVVSTLFSSISVSADHPMASGPGPETVRAHLTF